MASSQSFYFASHRSTANPNSKEIDLISPQQERKLAEKANFKVEIEPEILESLPSGSKAEEFFSRTRSADYTDPPIGSLVIERKVPVKLEPKVFLSVERLFLLWMHSALWLLAAALTILSVGYDDPKRLVYGITILPVAVGFICYSLFSCEYEIIYTPGVVYECLILCIFDQA